MRRVVKVIGVISALLTSVDVMAQGEGENEATFLCVLRLY